MTVRLPLRLGVVGCGYQGQLLARAASQVEALRIVACADTDLDRANKAAATAQAAGAHRSADELLREDLDAVFVATPHHLLCPVSMAALAAGKHVLAEKPIGINATEVAMLDGAARRSGATFMAGYSFRYLPQPRRAHELLSAGLAGRIEAIGAAIVAPPTPPGWRSDTAAGGGPLLFFGSHVVDQILWYAGEAPVEVYANTRYHAETGIDATACFQIRFAGGAVAQCLVSDQASGLSSYVHVIGRGGTLHLSLPAFPNYELTAQSTALPEYAEAKTVASHDERETAILSMLTAELSEFAEAIVEHRQPAITARDGQQVLVVLDAVGRSGRNGAPVTL